MLRVKRIPSELEVALTLLTLLTVFPLPTLLSLLTQHKLLTLIHIVYEH